MGVIAGTLNFNPLLASMLPKANDGKVSVASTKVEGMADHLTLKVDHTLMMNSPRVIREVKYFLKNGCFSGRDSSGRK